METYFFSIAVSQASAQSASVSFALRPLRQIATSIPPSAPHFLQASAPPRALTFERNFALPLVTIAARTAISHHKLLIRVPLFKSKWNKKRGFVIQMPERARYTEVLHIRIRKAFKDDLERVAKSLGESTSELARDLMEISWLLMAGDITFREVVEAAIPTIIDKIEKKLGEREWME